MKRVNLLESERTGKHKELPEVLKKQVEETKRKEVARTHEAKKEREEREATEGNEKPQLEKIFDTLSPEVQNLISEESGKLMVRISELESSTTEEAKNAANHWRDQEGLLHNNPTQYFKEQLLDSQEDLVSFDNDTQVNQDVAAAQERMDNWTKVLNEVSKATETPQEKEIAKEIDALPKEEKRRLAEGLNWLGFSAEKFKNDGLAWIFKGLGDKMPKGRGWKGSVSRFCQELNKGFVENSKIAAEKIEDVKSGKNKRVLGNLGSLTGNTIKYGRMVNDFFGLTAALPYRYVMMGAMGGAEIFRGAKGSRLKNEDVIEKNRTGGKYQEFGDERKEKDLTEQEKKDKETADQVAEEAWAIYEKAGGKKNGDPSLVSSENLKDAYLKEMPKDLVKRLGNSTVASFSLQKVFQKQIEFSISGLNKKVEKIYKNTKLNPEQQKAEEEKLFKVWKKDLEEWDSMISQVGVVNKLAATLKNAEIATKGLVTVMTIDTVYESIIHGFETMRGSPIKHWGHWDLKDVKNLFISTEQEVPSAPTATQTGEQLRPAISLLRKTEDAVSTEELNNGFQEAFKKNGVNTIPTEPQIQPTPLLQENRYIEPSESLNKKFIDQFKVGNNSEASTTSASEVAESPTNANSAPDVINSNHPSKGAMREWITGKGNEINGQPTVGKSIHIDMDEVQQSVASQVNPELDVVQKGKGIEHVLIKQIKNDPELAKALAKSLGFEGDLNDKKVLQKFAGRAAHEVAKFKGYVDTETGEEIRVRPAGEIAYKLTLSGDDNDPFNVEEFRKVDGEFKLQEPHGNEPEFEGDKKEEYEYREKRHPKINTETAPYTNTVAENNSDQSSAENTFTKSVGENQPQFGQDNFGKRVFADRIKSMGEVGADSGLETDSIPDKAVPFSRQSAEQIAAMQRFGLESEKIKGIRDSLEAMQHSEVSGSRGLGAGIDTNGSAGSSDVTANIAGNKFDLPAELLRQVDEVYTNNIKSVFPNSGEWNNIKGQNASGFMKNGHGLSGLKKGDVLENASFYLQKLKQVSELKPNGKSFIFFGKDESVEQYVARALQKVAKMGKLNALKFEFKF